MRSKQFISVALGMVLTAGLAVVPTFAQQQYPPQTSYPPADPAQSGQYPPQQGQYPPPQQPQYPPPQQGYPQQQPGYPQQQGYPPQGYPQAQQPPLMPPQQLDQLVAPIALYPDGLLALVLTAATFSNEIPEAAGWANQHAYIKGDALAQAIRQDNLPWDPSVIALLPFPQVLSYMAQYMAWTEQLGNAVLAQRPDVMDAVQRLRTQANQYGYLHNPQFEQYEQVRVVGPGDIEIVPAGPYYYVPYYNPAVVFYRPRPGFFVGAAFSFGPAITIGAAFAPWGWGGIGFGWREHSILVDNHPWGRTWVNRGAYVHPYATPYRRVEGPRVENHAYRAPAPRAHEEHGEHH